MVDHDELAKRVEQARIRADYAEIRNLAGMSYEDQLAAHAEARHWRCEYESLAAAYRKIVDQETYSGIFGGIMRGVGG